MLFPNKWSEVTLKNLEIVESLMVSNISHRSIYGRKSLKQLNPYGKYSENTPLNWSNIVQDALYNPETTFKIVSINYLVKNLTKDSIDLLEGKFNQSAGDVKDVFNKVYGYSLKDNGLTFINQAYLDFKVGEALPTIYLNELLEKLELCSFLMEHKRELCEKFHDSYGRYLP